MGQIITHGELVLQGAFVSMHNCRPTIASNRLATHAIFNHTLPAPTRRTKMKRRTLVEYEDASPEVQAIYEEIREAMGSPAVPNFLKALGNNENVLRAIWQVTKNTMIEGEIPSLLKQLILFKISIKAGNEYCTALHGHAALNLDPTLSYDDLIKLSEGENSTKLPASFRVALEIVTQAALQPKSVADEDFDFEDQLRDEGFSEREIDELMAQAYFGVMMNTLTDSFDIPWESPFPPEAG
jgi:alkylhydroperoxidase family enzyme